MLKLLPRFGNVCHDAQALGLLRKSYVIGSFFKLQEAKKESAREVEQLLNQADIVCGLLQTSHV
jgi:hypothetical protein